MPTKPSELAWRKSMTVPAFPDAPVIPATKPFVEPTPERPYVPDHPPVPPYVPNPDRLNPERLCPSQKDRVTKRIEDD